MKRLMVIGLALGFLVFLIIFGALRPRPATEPRFEVKKEWPYRFVASKREQTNFKNVMHLYAYDGPLDIEELKAFCRERKGKSPAEVFYFVVIFNSPENAKFPSTPFTARYDTDDETRGHIRAIYEYNRANGFSELYIREQNRTEKI